MLIGKGVLGAEGQRRETGDATGDDVIGRMSHQKSLDGATYIRPHQSFTAEPESRYLPYLAFQMTSNGSDERRFGILSFSHIIISLIGEYFSQIISQLKREGYKVMIGQLASKKIEYIWYSYIQAKTLYI